MTFSVTTDDVKARLGREFLPMEEAKVSALLDDAEVELRRIGARVDDPDYLGRIRSVACAMVLRAARLPDALVSEIPNQEQTGFPASAQYQGVVYVRRSELRTLGIPTIRAVRTSPGNGYASDWYVIGG